MFSDFPLSRLTLVKNVFIILMTSGSSFLSGLSSGVYLSTASSSKGYRPRRVVGFVKYPFSSNLRDSGFRSVSLSECQHSCSRPTMTTHCRLTSTNFWKAKFAPFSFSNSYFPKS